jgi:PadR family transcriptional regulator, regulatory protein PadR
MQDSRRSVSPGGVLPMLILRILRSGQLHGYGIAQRIHGLSREAVGVEQGVLYPTLQKMLAAGWVRADWGTSDTKRKVRFYRLTSAGHKQLAAEIGQYRRLTSAIQKILRTA